MSNQLNNIIPEWILRRLPYNHYNIDVNGKNRFEATTDNC